MTINNQEDQRDNRFHRDGTMSINTQSIKTLQLNAKTEKELIRLANGIEQQLSDNLQSLCVYGSAARGEWHAKLSDVNILLITAESGYPTLEELSPLFIRAYQKSSINPMILNSKTCSRRQMYIALNSMISGDIMYVLPVRTCSKT